MGKIRLLPPSIVGKIAAGEVIERPASVVKELIENSIDAQATSITIFIKDCGISEIKVIDDGEGMSHDDVTTAFLRHATSKISEEKDLYNIQTLGFRGEALYSIAQVSKIRVITQQREEDIGTELYLVGGKIIAKRPTITRGTTVEVRELFFNIPVRRKFLKSANTERYHIIETVQNYSLAYPEISFSLFIDNEEILNLPSVTSVKERISQLFGLEFNKKLNYKEVSNGYYKLSLFITDEKFSRKPKDRQLIFLNRRPIRDPLLISTLYKAFEIRENHPYFFMYLNVPPSEIDFNVHPTKKEVKFQNPQIIHDLIFEIVQKRDFQTLTETNTKWDITSSLFTCSLINFFQLNSSIVVINTPEGVLFLDFHAAHERVNYEKILNKFENKILKLLFPEVINLSTSDYLLIKEHLHLLREIGIDAEDFGKNSIIIRNIPEILRNADIASVIESIVQTIREENLKLDLSYLIRKIAATVACHRSLRSDSRINSEELKVLIHQLEKTSDPDHCPHGRPIKKFFTLDEIKKWFSR